MRKYLYRKDWLDSILIKTNGIKKNDILIGMKVQGLGVLNLRGVAKEVLR
jgi:hypothetical protein